MDLEARKISFVQEFLRLQNEDIISGLEELLRKRKNELFEQSLHPKTLNQLETEIDFALLDSEKDNVTLARDLKDKIDKWT